MITSGPLSKLVELLDTQGWGFVQWVLLETSYDVGPLQQFTASCIRMRRFCLPAARRLDSGTKTVDKRNPASISEE